VSSIAGVRLLYPIDETTSLLGIERTTLYRLLRDGEVERVKIGRRTLIPADSIAQYVGRLREVGTDERHARVAAK